MYHSGLFSSVSDPSVRHDVKKQANIQKSREIIPCPISEMVSEKEDVTSMK
jgi:hypothetical protein